MRHKKNCKWNSTGANIHNIPLYPDHLHKSLLLTRWLYASLNIPLYIEVRVGCPVSIIPTATHTCTRLGCIINWLTQLSLLSEHHVKPYMTFKTRHWEMSTNHAQPTSRSDPHLVVVEQPASSQSQNATMHLLSCEGHNAVCLLEIHSSSSVERSTARIVSST